ncbi:MAG: ammonia-forming cytochrome c nitrite reductase subunit c552 [Ignavibacteria bacterium]|nr:ammonia-forming cytochrome c nitrite reductase subunit c552 [Ignavibacteria bacterium]
MNFKSTLRLVIVIAFTASIQQLLYSQKTQSDDHCFNCHEVLDGRLKKPADLFKKDIHHQKGVTCAGCHGGISSEEDQDKAMDTLEGFIRVPKGRSINKVCAKCHKKQSDAFLKSFHGSDTKGKQPIIVNCIVCHGIHNIVPVKNKNSAVNGANIVKTCSKCHSNAQFMKKYNPGLNIDQFEKYKTSGHGKKVFSGDNKAANCASCHGNHDIKKVNDPNSKVYFSNVPETCNKCHGDSTYMKQYNIPTDQYTKYKGSIHGVALLEKGNMNAPNCTNCHGNHGASVPETKSISLICGSCHIQNSLLYEESPHKSAFSKEKKNDCVVCHGNHGISKPGDEMLGSGEKSVCIKCHVNNDKGFIAAVLMKNMIDSLLKEMESANHSIYLAESMGMDLSEAKFEWAEINEALMIARTGTHFGHTDKFVSSLKNGFKLTENAKVISEQAVNDFYKRRNWLAYSLIFSIIIFAALFLKLRKIEKMRNI